MINRKKLLDAWVHGYAEYRLRRKRQCFTTDTIAWWEKRQPAKEGFRWGGELAAALLTSRFLRPGKLTVYADPPPFDLVVEANLQTSTGGWAVELEPLPGAADGPNPNRVHPLLVYGDLIATGDNRNAEAAHLYLCRPFAPHHRIRLIRPKPKLCKGFAASCPADPWCWWAFARDLIYCHAHGMAWPKATFDIDISIGVASWTEYRQACDALLKPKFRNANSEHPESSPTRTGKKWTCCRSGGSQKRVNDPLADGRKPMDHSRHPGGLRPCLAIFG